MNAIAEYWKNRCLLAEKFIELSPGDTDITGPQYQAFMDWQEMVKKEPVCVKRVTIIPTPTVRIREAVTLYGDGTKLLCPKCGESSFMQSLQTEEEYTCGKCGLWLTVEKGE